MSIHWILYEVKYIFDNKSVVSKERRFRQYCKRQMFITHFINVIRLNIQYKVITHPTVTSQMRVTLSNNGMPHQKTLETTDVNIIINTTPSRYLNILWRDFSF